MAATNKQGMTVAEEINFLEQQQLMLRREKLKRDLQTLYQLDPFQWAYDKFGMGIENFIWSQHDIEAYKNHKWDGSKNPLYHIWYELAKNRNVGVESATGTGKSYIGALIALWFLDNFENSLVVIIAPTASQLKDNLWSEVGRWMKYFLKFRPDADFQTTRLLMGAEDPDDPDRSWQITCRSGGAAQAKETIAKIQGFHRKDMLFIIDEAAGIAQGVMNTIINTCVAGHNRILTLANPDSRVDPNHKFCLKKTTKHIRISAYDHPNVVLGKEIIEGAVTRASIEDRAEDYGIKSDIFESRVRGKCPDSGENQLIDLDAFNFCCDTGGSYIPYDNSYPAVGVDPADSKSGDKAAAAYGHKNHMKVLREFVCPNSSKLADNIVFGKAYKTLAPKDEYFYNLPALSKYGIKASSVGVDSVGVGSSTCHRFEDLEYVVTRLAGGQNRDMIPLDAQKNMLYQFVSLRCQMYYVFAQDVANRRIKLHLTKSQRKDIEKFIDAITWEKKRGGRISVTPKADLKEILGSSPNNLDALVYWNWIRKFVPVENDLSGEVFSTESF